MADTKLIKAITEADIPLELVGKEEYNRLKAQDHTYVSARQLKSSNGILVSEGFSRCQGICLMDSRREVGALGHNHPSYDPYDTWTGAWTGGEFHLEDPRKIFDDTKTVLAVHVYDMYNYEYPENWIRGALSRAGIENIVHIPILSHDGKSYWRDIALDVKDGSVYVFPTDFEAGIKYRPEICR